MLNLGTTPSIFICHSSVDFRKGFEGLCALVEQHFQQNVLGSFAYFVFLNKNRDRLKILYWDNDGLAIWYKRLEVGRFPQPSADKPIIDRKEFFLLLEGVIPKRFCKRYKVKI